ncbi:MAG: molybdopterin-binding protein [Proteobacteria bacterium]|nr:molybdopterin-binding protein [Pseudomonadota bacterium]MBU1234135.1 molybdopterin-binding protein [Pseudomonadota bacterium]MBU1419284.1 molybdopterin-binding protein [Pseudomonadota bacterium]MBU1453227.1 molybdopterin-binding protein [Pseudomonadota bacterium]
MKKTVAVDEAVGMVLPHDITEIVKDKFKGRAFTKGHIIRAEDVEHLKRLGKEHIYVLKLGPEEIHENEAAQLLADVLAGPGTTLSAEPVEGKIAIHAACDGLLKVNEEALYRFNLLGEVMCSTLQTNTPVKKGETIAATRLIPLISQRNIVEQATVIAQQTTPVLEVKELRKARAGLVITGNEVFSGRIEDRFEKVLREKLTALGSEVICVTFAPDDIDTISEAISASIEKGADLIVTSGGMSVDPDDVTRMGIAKAGATDCYYGTPVLPGAMFLSGHIGDIPVLGLPACGMFHKITVFDLVLPRILTGESIGREEFARMGHGGLCRNCKQCQYPVCNFGK